MYTVVIRTHNSSLTIGECIKSILKQSVKADKIIVVDSFSTDNTIDIIEKYKNVNIVYYPKNKEFNYSYALNIGIKDVLSDFVLILSSHVILINQEHVEWMIKSYNTSNDVVAVSCYRCDKKIKSKGQFSEINIKKIDLNNFEGQGMYNFCSLLKKTDWVKHPFREDILRCEDQEWSYFFIKNFNSSTLFIDLLVYYANPFYNIKKDLWDYIYMDKYIFPGFITEKMYRKYFRKAKKELFEFKFKDLYSTLLVLFNLKFRKFRRFKFKSSYF